MTTDGTRQDKLWQTDPEREKSQYSQNLAGMAIHKAQGLQHQGQTIRFCQGKGPAICALSSSNIYSTLQEEIITVASSLQVFESVLKEQKTTKANSICTKISELAFSAQTKEGHLRNCFPLCPF